MCVCVCVDAKRFKQILLDLCQEIFQKSKEKNQHLNAKTSCLGLATPRPWNNDVVNELRREPIVNEFDSHWVCRTSDVFLNKIQLRKEPVTYYGSERAIDSSILIGYPRCQVLSQTKISLVKDKSYLISWRHFFFRRGFIWRHI